jgi:hypothetical protein
MQMLRRVLRNSEGRNGHDLERRLVAPATPALRGSQGVSVEGVQADLSRATPYGNAILDHFAAYTHAAQAGDSAAMQRAQAEAEGLLAYGNEQLEAIAYRVARMLIPEGFRKVENPPESNILEYQSVNGESGIRIAFCPKSFGSLYRKVQALETVSPEQLTEQIAEGKDVTELAANYEKGSAHPVTDIYRMRIITKDMQALERAWRLVDAVGVQSGTLSDYIAQPKKNGYKTRSGVVVNPEDPRFMVEVQVRTEAMDKAAHNNGQLRHHLKPRYWPLDQRANEPRVPGLYDFPSNSGTQKRKKCVGILLPGQSTGYERVFTQVQRN